MWKCYTLVKQWQWYVLRYMILYFDIIDHDCHFMVEPVLTIPLQAYSAVIYHLLKETQFSCSCKMYGAASCLCQSCVTIQHTVSHLIYSYVIIATYLYWSTWYTLITFSDYRWHQHDQMIAFTFNVCLWLYQYMTCLKLCQEACYFTNNCSVVFFMLECMKVMYFYT